MTKQIQTRKPALATSPSQFGSELKGEFKRIEWPTKKEVVSATAVILVIVVVSTVTVTGLDLVFANLIITLRGLA